MPYAFFNADEASFIEAGRAADSGRRHGPGALEADVPVYIDRQLAGAWGAGAGLYRTGPWQSGTPEQGYQLPLCPERPRLRPRALCLLPRGVWPILNGGEPALLYALASMFLAARGAGPLSVDHWKQIRRESAEPSGRWEEGAREMRRHNGQHQALVPEATPGGYG